MDVLFNIFSSRELALLIWIAAIIVIMSFNKELRHSMRGILKAFFARKIVIIISALTLYVILSIVVLRSCGLWNINLLKDTAFWFFGFAMVTFFSINKAKNLGYFLRITKEAFKWTILIEFLVNFYTFHLATELILLPVIVFIAVTQAYSEVDKKHEEVNRVLKNFLTIIGLCYFCYALFKTITDYKRVFTLSNLYALILPPILTVLILPFFYLTAVYMQYEELFVRTDFMTRSIKASGKTRRAIFFAAKLNLQKIGTISKSLDKADIHHATDLNAYFRSLLQK